jgi:hypothetical protein
MGRVTHLRSQIVISSLGHRTNRRATRRAFVARIPRHAQALPGRKSYVQGVTLTKSLFTAGQQCHKLLWWKVHEPGAVELQPDKVLQDRFDQGAQVGALARDEFPGGVAVFERTFETHDVRIRTDVLLPDGNGLRLIEVKSASSVKPEHIPDAAVQAWVLEENGIDVTGVEIMHLNKDFKHPDQGALL